MDKAPDAFRTISEVADDLDIPQHVLRFWETRFTQIKPMKRSGGRRYYRPDDVDLLRGIRRLLYGEGYTIRGVQRILKENGIKAVQGLVDEAAKPAFAPVARAEPRLSAPAPRPAAKAPVIADEPEDEVEDDLEDDAEIEDAEIEGTEDETEDSDAEDGDAEEQDDESEADEDESDDESGEDDGADAVEPAPARKAPDIVARREPDLRVPAARAPEIRSDAARSAPRIEPRMQQAIGRTDPGSMSRANPAPQPRAEPVVSAPPPMPASRPVRSLDRERLEAVLEELVTARRALDAAIKDG